MLQKLQRFFQKKSVKYSIPFLVLVVGGSFGLKQFTENRYRFRRNKFLDKEEAEKWGILKKDKSEVTLETEFEKVKQIDISDWENKRGPRPWEQVTEK
ncbi:cytochrome c oxidase assembly protein COX16 homolog, mitochondrial-like isoform X1 [Daphnia pulicaria]|uniref:cytochrome c oxidase assembly protein COX16 homolog, mitochondrial-like isoform X1 n=1 Tax=Daphnia pulicaria TaxID=35523 RepID=UPI001EE9F791|nr:cytochrome c oxidase assembly protein COX16 homolog, mitochondrial-like isoform X1 [Daphnia pulicaria]